MRNVSQGTVRALPLPVPPIEEQRRIVESLEDHLSHLDAGHQGLAVVAKRVRALTKSVLINTVPVDAVTGWELTTVGEAGDIDLGRQRHPDWHYGPEMRPYLRVANVFEDRIDTADVMEMDFSGLFERFKLRPGDVLLNEGQSPEYLGRPAIYRGDPPDVAFTNSILRFRAHEDVLPEWALLVFRRHMHAGRFARESRITTNIAHLSAGRLKAVEFPKPPIDEQRRLVDLVQLRLGEVKRLEAQLALARRRHGVLRRAALRAAFEGRLMSRISTVEEVLAGVG